MQEKTLFPYLGPTGGGMTVSKTLAERMEALRVEYIEAFKTKNVELQSRIRKDEEVLALEIGNLAMKIANKDRQREIEKMRVPRILRVTEYYSVGADIGRGFGKPNFRENHVWLDIHEIEMIWGAKNYTAGIFTVRMKSGREIDVNADDFDLIERAMRERE